MKTRVKLCQLAAAVLATLAALLFLWLSFVAVTGIGGGEKWIAVDYWRAWVSFFSLVFAGVSTVMALIASAVFFDGLCDG